jgi:hypothetical protein
MFGGGGKMDGEGGFSRPALLIGNHDCFHERENIGILAFMKEIIRTGMASQGDTPRLMQQASGCIEDGRRRRCGPVPNVSLDAPTFFQRVAPTEAACHKAAGCGSFQPREIACGAKT